MVEAILESDLIVIAPSNPMASVMPILRTVGIFEAIQAAGAPVVAVSPIVSGVPITNEGESKRARSRAAMLRSIGRGATATDVATLYQGICRTFVLDVADATEADGIRALGVKVMTARTLVGQDSDSDLVDVLLGLRG